MRDARKWQILFSGGGGEGNHSTHGTLRQGWEIIKNILDACPLGQARKNGTPALSSIVNFRSAAFLKPENSPEG